jgi:predicted HTH domain antitoxin
MAVFSDRCAGCRNIWTVSGGGGPLFRVTFLSMQVTVEIPDDVAQKLTPAGRDPARTLLEAVAIEGYRSGTLTIHQTRRLLGFDTRFELDGFLKAHNVWEHAYSLEDLEQDRRTLQQLEDEDRPKK